MVEVNILGYIRAVFFKKGGWRLLGAAEFCHKGGVKLAVALSFIYRTDVTKKVRGMLFISC